MKTPLRILIKLKSWYIQSLSECSGRFDYGTVNMGCPTAQVSTLPRSFSTISTISIKQDENLKELIRVASSRSLDNKIEINFLRKQQGRNSPLIFVDMPKSQNVVFCKIDEDKAVEFEDDIKVNTDVYPKRRGHAVSKIARF